MENLNVQQRAAVEYISGNALVIAGAGSGKTRVLTYKIAYLMQHGYRPWQIMALTFTNKAANEMKERIGSLIGIEQARMLNMGTFHSVFLRILRYEASLIGMQPNFTIYDETDSRSLIKSIVKDMQLDDKVYKPATVQSHISMAKNEMLTPEEYARNSHFLNKDDYANIPATAQIYDIYQKRIRQANAMDFDDILLYTYRLLSSNSDVREKYRNKYHYILVDEYQDTNDVQQRILCQLANPSTHICVVGDDAQSIYGFRGANVDNILTFQETFSEIEETDGKAESRPAKIFKLEQNYRSTNNIVLAANSLIAHNDRQIQKTVFTEQNAGEPIALKYLYTDREEAATVSRDIQHLVRRQNLRLSEIAILYRNNAQSRTFEDQFRKDGIPYRIIGGLSFYQRKEIKDIIAYFRLVANNYDEEALRRIINYPARGIGATTVTKIMQHSHDHGMSPWDVITNLGTCGLTLPRAATTKLQDFTTLITTFSQSLQTKDVTVLGNEIIVNSGISNDIFGDTGPEAVSRQENVKEFLGTMKEFVDIRTEEGDLEHITLTDFLQEISLLTDIDSDTDSAEHIQLMTIHAAKGLEFSAVFIVGVEDNIIPTLKSQNSPRGIEEERRLLYVAITRAKSFCTISNVSRRYNFGKLDDNVQPSRFLKDIDRKYLRITNSKFSDDSHAYSNYRGRHSDRDIDRDFDMPEYLRPSASSFRQSAPSSRQSSPAFNQSSSKPTSDPSTRLVLQGWKKVTPTSRTSAQQPQFTTQPQSASAARHTQPSTSCGTDLAVGMKVMHDRFGIGTVKNIEDAGESRKATIDFERVGTKQLLLKFAKLEVCK